MKLWLLKVKHVYDEEFEDCGVFSSEEKMEQAKKAFLKKKKQESFMPDEFHFRCSTMELDKLEY